MTAPVPASGRQYRLEHADYTADIASVGAGLRRLRWRDRDLVVPYAAEDVRPYFRGALLAPWPNRVADGRWQWHGAVHQLPITEPERGNALHGLVLWLDWRARAVASDAVTLAATVWPQPGYPFLLDLEVTWHVTSDGLRCRLTATNGSSVPAPYGCSVHPYLVAASGSLDDWTVHAPAEWQLQVDERLIPTQLAAPPPEHDFRTPHPVAGAVIDHAYTGVQFRDGVAAVTVTDDSGSGSMIEFDVGSPWLQICTADRPGETGHRAGLAVEPMTCPPDALRSGQDLLVLDPGQRHVVSWLIAAV